MPEYKKIIMEDGRELDPEMAVRDKITPAQIEASGKRSSFFKGFSEGIQRLLEQGKVKVIRREGERGFIGLVLGDVEIHFGFLQGENRYEDGNGNPLVLTPQESVRIVELWSALEKVEGKMQSVTKEEVKIRDEKIADRVASQDIVDKLYDLGVLQ